jgi:thiol-disulfide isomerase/thioredoxin
MMAGRVFTRFLVVVTLVGVGCRNSQESKGKTSSVAESHVTVTPIDKDGLATLVANRNGKVLLLNVWATWCAPCVAEFPSLVKLSKSFDTSAVEVVAVSADYPDEVDSKIIPFLRKMNVPFQVHVAQFAHQEDFINAVNSDWSGALPATLIVDAQGKNRIFHVGELSFEEFKQKVDSMKGAP